MAKYHCRDSGDSRYLDGHPVGKALLPLDDERNIPTGESMKKYVEINKKIVTIKNKYHENNYDDIKESIKDLNKSIWFINENLKNKNPILYEGVKSLLSAKYDNILDKNTFMEYISKIERVPRMHAESEFTTIRSRALTPSECKELVGKILNKYYQEIGEATTEDKKLEAILRCGQDLEQGHFFPDGNGRTVYVTLYKFFLENKLSLPIFEYPGVLDCKSIHELKDYTKQAWNIFNKYLSKSNPS